MNAVVDQALHIAGPAHQSLVGLLSRPASAAVPPQTVAVLVIVGGPQYRVGSHRQFVLLARALARQGYTVLRFDYRGMGDSPGTLRDFEAVSDDVGCAIDALQAAAPHVKQVVLWGLCDGASAALLYLHDRRDPRVAGLALLNPWVRSQASLAKTHVKHYYANRLRSREFWAKLLTGKVALSAVAGLMDNLRLAFGGNSSSNSASQPAASYQQRMAQAWSKFRGSILLMLSERDLTAQEFTEYCAADAAFTRALKARPPLRVVLAGADHTCSTTAAQQAAEDATAKWLAGAFAPST